jgi:hypothetical protein
MNNTAHDEIVDAVAARLPGAGTRARAANTLRALYAAGYEVVPAGTLRELRDYLIAADHDGPVRYEQVLDMIDAALGGKP